MGLSLAKLANLLVRFKYCRGGIHNGSFILQ